MTDKYKLVERKAVPCEDVLDWARSFETTDRRVAQTNVGPLRISTVFLGLDHQYGGGPPLLFETMIFGKGFECDDYQTRGSTWDEAVAMHAKAVAFAEALVANAASDTP